jgi:hypothetical protein
MNIANAIRFVQSSSDPVMRARLAALTEAAPAPEAVIETLAAQQNPDGGWPFGGVAGRPSSLYDTCQMLISLIELDEVGSEPAERGRAFLLAQQSPRGWWRESARLIEFDLPMWLNPEIEGALVYTTAVCASTLAGTDDAEDLLAVDQAVGWLQAQVSTNGLLPGYRAFSTAWALPAITAIAHRESRTVRRMVGGLGDLLSAEWDAPMIGMLLAGLSQAGLPRATKVVERALSMLTSLQRPDGAWPDENGAADVNLTLQIVRAARRFGLR